MPPPLHVGGGGEPIPLDELAAPGDNTNLNASTTAHGLLRKLSNLSTEYLSGTGVFSVPAGGGGGAPTDATYITQTAHAGLSAEQVLADLATGLVKVTTGTGVLSIATAPADFVATGDSRLTDARTPTAHAASHLSNGSDPIAVATTTVRGTVELATDGESAASLVPQANDARLSDARTPTAHAASHLSGGSDPLAAATTTARGTVELATDGEVAASVVVQGNDARLSNARTPTAHASSHQPGGGDAMAVDAAAGTGSLRTLGTLATTAAAGNDARLSDARTPLAHAASHLSNGSDPIAAATTTVRGTVELATDGESAASLVPQANDARLSNARTPTAHATSHVTGGSDVIANAVAAGNAGLMTGADKTKLDGIAAGAEVNVNADWNAGSGDAQILNKPATFAPSAHATSHKSGGSDAIKLDELAAPTDITTLNATAALHGLLPKLSAVTTEFLRGDGAWATPVAAPGDTSKVLASGTSTILADTCRYIVARFEIASGAHLVLDAAGSMEIG